jgi:bacterioferritin (cytochrome b1)
MRSSIDALQRQLVDREEESVTLETKIRELRAEVAIRKNVKSSNDTSRGMTAENLTDIAGQKMKKVVARRHLLDSARSQAEEADFLRQELDRLRQRTFPSFVKAAKHRVAGHDSADER